jgi:flagellar basal body-associated protein FliL
MADESEGLEDIDDEGDGNDKPKKTRSKKQLMMIGGGGLLALLIVGGGGAYMMGWLDSLLGIEREKTRLEIDLGVPVRQPLPVIKADLKTGRCRSPFLRVEVVVQVNKNDVDLLIDNETAIVDRVRSHLREQERQDLVGKAGTDKLRFDLVNIINQVIAPARVHGILFKDFLLQ